MNLPKKKISFYGLWPLVLLLSFFMGKAMAFEKQKTLRPFTQQASHGLSAKSFHAAHYFSLPEAVDETLLPDLEDRADDEEDFHAEALPAFPEFLVTGKTVYRLIAGDSSPPSYCAAVSAVPLFILYHSWKSFLC